jgi:hypothetical protein
MGIKIKYTDPSINEFATDDIIINVESGSLFFKSNTNLYKLQGDNLNTPTTESGGDMWVRSGSNLYYNDGNVGIGTTTPIHKLDVNGSIRSTTTLVVSDKRLKKDILPIENALNKILALNGITYNWNKEFDPSKNLDDHNHLGLIAQDVEKILPQVINTESGRLQIKSVSYSDIIPVLIEAIKEQQNQINELKNQLKDIPYG